MTAGRHSTSTALHAAFNYADNFNALWNISHKYGGLQPFAIVSSQSPLQTTSPFTTALDIMALFNNVTTIYVLLLTISLLLILPPLIWHWRRNVSTTILICWILVINLCSLINAFIWPTDKAIYYGWNGPIFCDIQVKLIIASGAGQLGTVAAITRTLARILSDNISVIQTRTIRRRELIIDLILCFGVPVYMCLVHYIVQPTRYAIVSIAGCMPVVDRSWPSIVLLFIWTPIMAVIAAYYSGLVILRVHRHRKALASILETRNSGITKSRFYRLLQIALTALLGILPVCIYMFYTNLAVERLPYSWSEIHGSEWNYILKFPTNGKIAFERWFSIATAYLVFALFGFGGDAMTMYKGWLISCRILKLKTHEAVPLGSPGFESTMSNKSWWSRMRKLGKKEFEMDSSSRGSSSSMESVGHRISTQNMTTFEIEDLDPKWISSDINIPSPSPLLPPPPTVLRSPK